jgi:hypothetical protein
MYSHVERRMNQPSYHPYYSVTAVHGNSTGTCVGTSVIIHNNNNNNHNNHNNNNNNNNNMINDNTAMAFHGKMMDNICQMYLPNCNGTAVTATATTETGIVNGMPLPTLTKSHKRKFFQCFAHEVNSEEYEKRMESEHNSKRFLSEEMAIRLNKLSISCDKGNNNIKNQSDINAINNKQVVIYQPMKKKELNEIRIAEGLNIKQNEQHDKFLLKDLLRLSAVNNGILNHDKSNVQFTIPTLERNLVCRELVLYTDHINEYLNAQNKRLDDVRDKMIQGRGRRGGEEEEEEEEEEMDKNKESIGKKQSIIEDVMVDDDI